MLQIKGCRSTGYINKIISILDILSVAHLRIERYKIVNFKRLAKFNSFEEFSH